MNMDTNLPKISNVISLKTGETFENPMNNIKNELVPVNSEPIAMKHEEIATKNNTESYIRLKSKNVSRVPVENAKKCIRLKYVSYLKQSNHQNKQKSSTLIAGSTKNTSVRKIVTKKHMINSKQTKPVRNIQTSRQRLLHLSSSQAELSSYTSYSNNTKRSFTHTEPEENGFEPNFEPYYKEFDKQFKQKPMLQTILKDILMLHEEYDNLENQSVEDEINQMRTKHGLPLFEPEIFNPEIETPDNDDINEDDNFILISDDDFEEEDSTDNSNQSTYVVRSNVSHYEEQSTEKLNVITIDEDDPSEISENSCQSNSSDKEMQIVDKINEDPVYKTKVIKMRFVT
ncbi:uncharacterized protein LOC126739121 [Anthonomus grandis grandis]|uniref:uncharacterized protein LOC126739121 n=1 Tax=Anthonomus grandis grandis TaxID=2921223 RepID=UPI0021664E88|nr:uncharacterized protein LOC126739121 [Anthonomus grandis grandis]